VEEYCAEARTKLRGNATVLKCLVENFKSLTDQCQTEMSRAVRLALWDYKPGAALTAACDDDVDSQCPRVGLTGSCLGVCRVLQHFGHPGQSLGW
jgi:Golgi apparatus protein 1